MHITAEIISENRHESGVLQCYWLVYMDLYASSYLSVYVLLVYTAILRHNYTSMESLSAHPAATSLKPFCLIAPCEGHYTMGAIHGVG